ncbi:hypothetical protein CR513_04593, partial [Mucuna pruriens]
MSFFARERKENMSKNKQKKEKHEIECNEEESKKMSVFAKTKEVESALSAKKKLLVLLYKGVYFTNEFHSSLPCEIESLLQEFTNVFPNEVPHGLPPLRGIEHQIDLVPGCPIPNKPVYRTNPEETKEIPKQVNELLQKGFVRESFNPCSVPIILVPKKDGTWRMCVDSRVINKITESKPIAYFSEKLSGATLNYSTYEYPFATNRFHTFSNGHKDLTNVINRFFFKDNILYTLFLPKLNFPKNSPLKDLKTSRDWYFSSIKY